MGLVKVFFKRNIGKHKVGNEALVASGYMRNYLYPKGYCEYSANAQLIDKLKKNVEQMIKKDLEQQNKSAQALDYFRLLKCVIMIEKATDSGILYRAVKEKNIMAACIKNLTTYHNVNTKYINANKLERKINVRYIKTCGIYYLTLTSDSDKLVLPIMVSSSRNGAINMALKNDILTPEEVKAFYDFKSVSTKLTTTGDTTATAADETTKEATNEEPKNTQADPESSNQ